MTLWLCCARAFVGPCFRLGCNTDFLGLPRVNGFCTGSWALVFDVLGLFVRLLLAVIAGAAAWLVDDGPVLTRRPRDESAEPRLPLEIALHRGLITGAALHLSGVLGLGVREAQVMMISSPKVLGRCVVVGWAARLVRGDWV